MYQLRLGFSSVAPSQSLLTPSQPSVTPGLIAGLLSLQSPAVRVHVPWVAVGWVQERCCVAVVPNPSESKSRYQVVFGLSAGSPSLQSELLATYPAGGVQPCT